MKKKQTSSKPAVKIDETPTVSMWTDGSWKPRIANGTGGYAVLMESNGCKQAIFGNAKDTTINREEVKAIIVGLNALQAPCSVRICSDSMVAINGTNKLNGKANLDQWAEVAKHKAVHDIQMVKVKGHATGKLTTDEQMNQLADFLAQRAATMPV